MKISCDIIRDLLPLYADEMTSPASNELVEGHLLECDGCRQCLNDLSRQPELPKTIPVQTLGRVKKHIQKRRILTALLAVLLLVSLYVNVWTILDTYVYLTADQAVEGVTLDQEGRIWIHWKGHISGTARVILDEAPDNMGIVAQTRLRQLWFPKDQTVSQPMILDKQEDRFFRSGTDPREMNIWYYSYRDGKPEQLLWDGGAQQLPQDFSFEMRVHYRIAYYCVAAAVLTVALGVLAWKKRGTRAGKWLRLGSLFFGCSCIAVLCTSGGQFMDYFNDIPSKIIDSGVPFMPMFLTGLCAFALHDMKEQ